MAWNSTSQFCWRMPNFSQIGEDAGMGSLLRELPNFPKLITFEVSCHRGDIMHWSKGMWYGRAHHRFTLPCQVSPWLTKGMGAPNMLNLVQFAVPSPVWATGCTNEGEILHRRIHHRFTRNPNFLLTCEKVVWNNDSSKISTFCRYPENPQCIIPRYME